MCYSSMAVCLKVRRAIKASNLEDFVWLVPCKCRVRNRAFKEVVTTSLHSKSNEIGTSVNLHLQVRVDNIFRVHDRVALRAPVVVLV
jgi:hypothetical protein